MSVRVGRAIYDNKGQHTDPSYPGFTPIIVLTKSTAYGSLGPYVLKDDKGRIMENIWQAAKVYPKVPQTVARYSRWNHTIIWQHPEETHVDEKGELTPEYWAWRSKLENNKYHVRYPVGFDEKARASCLYALNELPDGTYEGPLDYVQGRMKIYLPVYCALVKGQRQFAELKNRLARGENLLIIEVDGPHQESLDYYMKTYGVDKSFIEQGTMLMTDQNNQIMLHDTKHAYGHGYCLALALLDKDVAWNY